MSITSASFHEHTPASFKVPDLTITPIRPAIARAELSQGAAQDDPAEQLNATLPIAAGSVSSIDVAPTQLQQSKVDFLVSRHYTTAQTIPGQVDPLQAISVYAAHNLMGSPADAGGGTVATLVALGFHLSTAATSSESATAEQLTVSRYASDPAGGGGIPPAQSVQSIYQKWRDSSDHNLWTLFQQIEQTDKTLIYPELVAPPEGKATPQQPITMTNPATVVAEGTEVNLTLDVRVFSSVPEVGYAVVNTDTGQLAKDALGHPIQAYGYWNTVGTSLPPGHYKIIYYTNAEPNPDKPPRLTFYTYSWEVKSQADFASAALNSLPQPSQTLDAYIAGVEAKIAPLKSKRDALPTVQQLIDSKDIIFTGFGIWYSPHAQDVLNQRQQYDNQINALQRIVDNGNTILHDGKGDGPLIPLKAVEIVDESSKTISAQLYLQHLKNGGVRIVNMTDPRSVTQYEGKNFDAAVDNFVHNADSMPFGYIAIARPQLASPEILYPYVAPGGDVQADIGHSAWKNWSEGLLFVAMAAGLFIPFVGEAEIAGISVGTGLFYVSTAAGVSSALADLAAKNQTEGGLTWDDRTAGDIFAIALQLALPVGSTILGKYATTQIGTGVRITQYADDGVTVIQTYAVTQADGTELAQLEQSLAKGGLNEAQQEAVTQRIQAILEGSAQRAAVAGQRSPAGAILTDDENAQIKSDFVAIGGDPDMLEFNTGSGTSYKDETNKIRVRGDVYPSTDPNATDPLSLLSPRGTLAHELGHAKFRGTALAPNSWQDELRADYYAAKYTPGLSDEDRRLLLYAAKDKAALGGVRLPPDDFMIKMGIYPYVDTPEVGSIETYFPWWND